MLVLSRADVEALLDPDQLVDAVASAMVDLSQERADVPTRNAAYVAEREGFLAAMPAFLPSARALTTKLVSLFPHNTDRPTHHAIIACFDPDNGVPIALLDGGYITATRTAAASALATRLLARPGSAIVSVIGTGVQGRAHARALSRLPGLELIQVAGRDPAKVGSLRDELSEGGIRAEAVTSVEEAVRSADVVCAATHADRPVVRRRWLRPGTHINSVGFDPAPTSTRSATTRPAAEKSTATRSATPSSWSNRGPPSSPLRHRAPSRSDTPSKQGSSSPTTSTPSSEN